MPIAAVKPAHEVYLAKKRPDPLSRTAQCHYAEPVTGNNRCTQPSEPGKAYCKKHIGHMPSGPGLASSLGSIGGDTSISKTPNGIGNR